MTDPVSILPDLPPRAARLIGQLDSGEVLGASRQLHLIGEALIALTEDYHGRQPALPFVVNNLIDHLVATRGASSQAIPNGLRLMLGTEMRDIKEPGELRHMIVTGVDAFRQKLGQWLRDVEHHGVSLLRTAQCVLVYDYSSSVAALVREAARPDLDLTVVIPEARSLDGGRKYLDDWEGLPLRMHMIPDAAIAWALRDADIVLVGAETLTLEGGCYNTIGTNLVARIAAQEGVPFYVASILLKADPTGGIGAGRAVPMLNFLHSFSWDESSPASTTVNFSFPDLDYTPPTLVTGLATELGVLKPSDLRAAINETLSPGGTDAR